MTRRGFTLVETVLAMVVGSLILAAALATLVTVEDNGRALGEHAQSMNDLAAAQQAVRRAMASLHVAPAGAFANALGGDLDQRRTQALMNTAFPDPVPGLAPRFEMTSAQGRPRVEVVLREPLLERPGSHERAAGDPPTLHAGELPAHRGVFELREPTPTRARGREPTGYELWWTPLPPANLPDGVLFDEHSLPPATRLVRNVEKLVWTAFIDSQRVPNVRATEAMQLPAFIELEVATAHGGYGNWTFELGYSTGAEFVSPVASASPEPDTDTGDETDPADDGGDSGTDVPLIPPMTDEPGGANPGRRG